MSGAREKANNASEGIPTRTESIRNMKQRYDNKLLTRKCCKITVGRVTCAIMQQKNPASTGGERRSKELANIWTRPIG